MEKANSRERVLQHYRKEAAVHGLDSKSTMLDEKTREMEVSGVLAALEYVRAGGTRPRRLLEVGCGNGYLLGRIRACCADTELVGVDYSEEMIALAAERKISDCRVQHGDVRSVGFDDSEFDVVVSERCIINLRGWSEQVAALKDIQRVLKRGGYLVLIEAFTDGLENLNRARTELGLPVNVIPPHNVWLDKEHFYSLCCGLYNIVDPRTDDKCSVPPANFLSTHYFVSRVLYPSITKREVLYNTEFVKFFEFFPNIGNYAPIQFFLLRKPK